MTRNKSDKPDKTDDPVPELTSPFSSEDVLAVIAAPADGRLDGPSVVYFSNGQKCLEGEWRNGQLHGQTTTWYESGQIRQLIHYQHGAAHGEYRFFHPNGRQAVQGQYAKGEKVGVWRYWDETGRLVKEENL